MFQVEKKGKYGWHVGPSGRGVEGEFDEKDKGQIAYGLVGNMRHLDITLKAKGNPEGHYAELLQSENHFH